MDDCGFSMPFKVTAMPIGLDRALIPPLLKRAKVSRLPNSTPLRASLRRQIQCFSPVHFRHVDDFPALELVGHAQPGSLPAPGVVRGSEVRHFQGLLKL